MAEERPYRLLIRLGIILVPILAGILLWSYYHPPVSVPPKPAATIPAPVMASDPNPAESAAEPADPVAGASGIAPAPTPSAFVNPVVPPLGALRMGTGGSQTGSAPGAGVGTATPRTAGLGQQPASGRERPKPRDPRKQETSSAHRTIEKLDKQIDRKLSICSGC